MILEEARSVGLRPLGGGSRGRPAGRLHQRRAEVTTETPRSSRLKRQQPQATLPIPDDQRESWARALLGLRCLFFSRQAFRGLGR